MTEMEVICENCERAEMIPADQWSTKCTKANCKKEDSDVLLAPSPEGKKYVLIKCRETSIDCVDDNALMVNCKCCEESVELAIDSMVVKIINGQNVYGSTEATAFIKRRIKEIEKTRNALDFFESMYDSMPATQRKIKQVHFKLPKPQQDFTFMLEPYVTSCDNCGTTVEIESGLCGAFCTNENCAKRQTAPSTNIVRPCPKDQKYVLIQCNDCSNSFCKVTLDTSSIISCRSCYNQFAIDTVVSTVINNQPLYATVLTTGFITRQCAELNRLIDAVDTTKMNIRIQLTRLRIEENDKNIWPFTFVERAFNFVKETLAAGKK